MDLTKAQRLLAKIQAFLDQGTGNELSRLEKDLMKTYILQLYEAVTHNEPAPSSTETSRQAEIPVHKKQVADIPPVIIPPTPRTEPEKPVFSEIKTPKPQEIPLDKKIQEPEPVVIFQKPDPKPVQIPIKEVVRETIHSGAMSSASHEIAEGLANLFELPKNEDVADRFSHIPIQSIESAMGLNERIFTLNELFGGDKGLFELTCAELNSLASFTEAKKLLLQGPARHFNWSDPERVKMAEQFIRIVARRYPRT